MAIHNHYCCPYLFAVAARQCRLLRPMVTDLRCPEMFFGLMKAPDHCIHRQSFDCSRYSNHAFVTWVHHLYCERRHQDYYSPRYRHPWNSRASSQQNKNRVAAKTDYCYLLFDCNRHLWLSYSDSIHGNANFLSSWIVEKCFAHFARSDSSCLVRVRFVSFWLASLSFVSNFGPWQILINQSILSTSIVVYILKWEFDYKN